MESNVPDVRAADHAGGPHQVIYRAGEDDGEVAVLGQVLLRGEPEEDREDARVRVPSPVQLVRLHPELQGDRSVSGPDSIPQGITSLTTPLG